MTVVVVLVQQQRQWQAPFFVGFSAAFISYDGTWCLKITEKVSFNIASEASYVYILSGQKLIKNVKNPPFWRVFENLKLVVKQCYQTLRQVSYNRTKSLWSFVHFDVKIRRLKYLEIVGRINKNFDVKIQFKRNIFIDL